MRAPTNQLGPAGNRVCRRHSRIVHGTGSLLAHFFPHPNTATPEIVAGHHGGDCSQSRPVMLTLHWRRCLMPKLELAVTAMLCRVRGGHNLCSWLAKARNRTRSISWHSNFSPSTGEIDKVLVAKARDGPGTGNTGTTMGVALSD